jgi:ACS family glucarate transporter-like MFS transporter
MLLLCASYSLQGYVLFMYVFWLYLYLVEVRGFSALRGGVFAGLPWIAAAILTPVGGFVSDRLSRRLSLLAGRRIVAAGGLSLAALFLSAGLFARDAYLAIAALSLSVGFLESVEGVFWATAIDTAGAHAGAAGGLLNMVGSAGGVASTALVPVLIEWVGWSIALGSAAVLSIIGALIWFAIRSPPE